MKKHLIPYLYCSTVPYPFVLFVGGAVVYFLKLRAEKPNHFLVRYSKFLNERREVWELLVIWVILGFVFQLDYTLQSGCMIFSEPLFSKENMMYSGLALLAFDRW